ncbi:hypothetical protein KJ937_01320, partial [Patescibacteria group bacterium]|nr:hypothetical protein [Patescibacteria group bacterium]
KDFSAPVEMTGWKDFSAPVEMTGWKDFSAPVEMTGWKDFPTYWQVGLLFAMTEMMLYYSII